MFAESNGFRSSLRYLSSAVAIWYFYKHFVRPFFSPLRKIPGCPYIPILGNMLETIKEGANNNGFRWMQKYNSSIIRFYFLGGEGTVLIGDPALVKHILVSSSKNYQRTNSTRFLSGIVPGFLVLTSGEEHHALRRLINPVFTAHAVTDYVSSFEKIGRKLIDMWSEAIAKGGDIAVVEAQDNMNRLTLDAICQCGFDYDMKALDNDQSPEVKAFKHILTGLQLGILDLLRLNWLPTKKNRKISEDLHTFRSTITQVIASKQEKMQKGILSKDILSQLLQARDENGYQLTQASLYSQVGGFLFAGFETTSTSLTWTLMELATRPEVQEKARQEVLRLMPDEKQPFSSHHLDSMTYLTCVIKESLRLNTPISTLFRRNVKDDYLGKYFIPAGTLIGINMGALHRLPQNWSDPLEFQPERFQDNYNKYAFLPFGAGPYMCIGNIFSMAEVKVTLALILRAFKIRIPTGYKYKMVRKVTIQPSPPLQLIVEPLF